MKKDKLLLVSPLPPPYGGIARWTEQLLSYLDKDKSINYAHLDTAVRWRSVHSRVWVRLIGGTFQLVFNFLKYLNFLITGSNIIHLASSGSFGLVRDLVFSLTAKLFRAKFITHIRFGRVPAIFEKKSYEYYLLYFIFKFSDKIICIDRNTYNFLFNFSKGISNKLYLIPNCIDYSFKDESIEYSSKSNIISFVGWIKREKGVEELIDAFLNLSLRDWNLKLIGPIDQTFFAELNEKYLLSSKQNIQFLSSLDNREVLLELKKSKVFALPSYTEGFPNVVLEAMATKNAIIATKVGALPEMLENKSGILVNVADSKDLEKALKFLLQDDSLKCLLSENAFHRCKEIYSIDTVVDQYLSIWKSLERN